MATVTVRNGIDVHALLDTIEAIKTKPELAQFTFRAATRQPFASKPWSCRTFPFALGGRSALT